MRFLFSTLPGLGHFFPIVPLAWAARAEVFRTMQARTGAFPFAQGNFSTDMLTAVSGLFAEISDRTVEVARSWQPDVVVHTPIGGAGPLAATLLRDAWDLGAARSRAEWAHGRDRGGA